jgi:Flp pilus assembly pilin Flp
MRTQRHQGRTIRGAVAVEYALGAALILVASIGAINALTDSASSNLSSHGSTAGAPDLPDTGIVVTTSTTAVPPPPPPTDPPLPPTTATASVDGTSTGLEPSPANRWFARIDVSARDGGGDVLIGVTIQVTWTWLEGSTPATSNQTCNVVSTGVCSFQIGDLRTNGGNAVTSVSVTVDSISGTNPPILFTPTGTPTVLAAP